MNEQLLFSFSVNYSMSTKKSIQSIEPNIADLVNGWLKSYQLDYKLEQESLNHEIDTALNEYYSKNGGVGGNRPDTKLLLTDKDLKPYPILIEYKGYKEKLIKLNAEGQVENKTAKNEPNLKKHQHLCCQWCCALCQCHTASYELYRRDRYWCDRISR